MQESIIETQEVSKQYAAHLALDKVSLKMPKGQITGLLGPNGAGKTSLIRIITQITRADSGIVLFEGQPLRPKHIEGIGYLPEERGLYKKMEVGEQLLYLAQLKGLSRADAITRCKTWVDKFDIGGWWKKKVEELSKGMQQKVQFISTVIHEPTLIILDEPFTGFDPNNAKLIKDEILALKAKGASIIFSTHRMESVEEMCDYIIFINKSRKILEAELQEVKNQFRTNTYELVYHGDNLQTPHNTEIVEDRIENGTHICTLRHPSPMGRNELLKQVMQEVEVVSFSEKMPAMSDIFIKLTSEN